MYIVQSKIVTNTGGSNSEKSSLNKTQWVVACQSSLIEVSRRIHASHCYAMAPLCIISPQSFSFKQ